MIGGKENVHRALFTIERAIKAKIPLFVRKKNGDRFRMERFGQDEKEFFRQILQMKKPDNRLAEFVNRPIMLIPFMKDGPLDPLLRQRFKIGKNKKNRNEEEKGRHIGRLQGEDLLKEKS